MTPLEKLRFHYANRDVSARAWRESGGSVVGYFCDSVPVELIMAAGLLPYRISGVPDRATDLVAEHVTTIRPPFTRRAATIGFVETALDAVLGGALDFVDHLVVPHTRKMVQAAYRQLLLAQEARPDLRLPSVHYLDKAYIPSPAASRFNRAALEGLADAVASWSGTPLTTHALERAVDVMNTSRALLARVAALRKANPPRITGPDALAVFGSAAVMPREAHNDLLAAFLEDTPPPVAPTDPVRIHLAGSPQDHPAVYRAIETCGAVVVGDDHCWGDRCAWWPVRSGGAPLDGIAARYDAMPACSVEFPLARTVERCVDAAVGSRPDGVIFFDLDGDEAQLWETPDEIAALRAAGIPTLHLPRQPYTAHLPEDVTAQIAAFVTSLHTAGVR
ncbi:2-hydroxyacyl-CoA dehydratase family protein [Pseudonocardia zijingensis]|uniref:2-hydroxyacyl-CoA dehydratase subunit D n=1 Tax=Pseudonocardia zijingensis TaxID=153376 RepID=UPI0031D7B75A